MSYVAYYEITHFKGYAYYYGDRKYRNHRPSKSQAEPLVT